MNASNITLEQLGLLWASTSIPPRHHPLQSQPVPQPSISPINTTPSVSGILSLLISPWVMIIYEIPYSETPRISNHPNPSEHHISQWSPTPTIEFFIGWTRPTIQFLVGRTHPTIGFFNGQTCLTIEFFHSSWPPSTDWYGVLYLLCRHSFTLALEHFFQV